MISVPLDVLDDGAVVFDYTGREALNQNTAMESLLRREADSAALQKVVHEAAVAAAWSARRRSPATRPDSTTLSRGWRAARGTAYRLRAIQLPPGSTPRKEAIVVLVQRLSADIPEASELIQRFGFTHREAEVASWLAHGHSDRHIASSLGL